MAVANELGRESLIAVLSPGDVENGKAELILEVMEDVKRFAFFEKSLKVGVRYSPDQLTFSQASLYSDIMDEVNRGRKTRV